MTDRDAQIDDFLTGAGWAHVQRSPLAGDLSARRYLRLRHPDGRTAVLMNAPPDQDPSTPAFVRMTGWLRAANLSAPAILAAMPEHGLLLLEDFGDQRVSDLLASDPSMRPALYDAVLDLLILVRVRAPASLPCPGADELVRMTTLADDHYPGLNSGGLAAFRTLLETVLAELLDTGASVSLRDFHADNLMWLPKRSGLARLGLLDYQDAFLTHPAYDLVSLLTDARTDIDTAFRVRMIEAYASRTGDDPGQLNLAFAALSAQRNLRILGIFARAARRLGKPGHLPKLPRVHRYFAEALSHPAFSSVAEEALSAIPEPTPAFIEAMA